MTDAKEAVIRVGDGRGFIVKDAGRIRLGWRGAKHIVITAAHCLPFLPPCRAYCELEERTYRALLGPLGQERAVWAGCLFVDLVADIAVLGAPEIPYERFLRSARRARGDNFPSPRNHLPSLSPALASPPLSSIADHVERDSIDHDQM
jgi:hypothetical protein